MTMSSDEYDPNAQAEARIVEYVEDEPVCSACRKDRHEYCISKKGFECWCEEEDAHVKP